MKGDGEHRACQSEPIVRVPHIQYEREIFGRPQLRLHRAWECLTEPFLEDTTFDYDLSMPSRIQCTALLRIASREASLQARP